MRFLPTSSLSFIYTARIIAQWIYPVKNVKNVKKVKKVEPVKTPV